MNETIIPTPALYDVAMRKLNDINAEIAAREFALDDLRNENCSMLHEDVPAQNWVRFVPIVGILFDLILIVLILTR